MHISVLVNAQTSRRCCMYFDFGAASFVLVAPLTLCKYAPLMSVARVFLCDSKQRFPGAIIRLWEALLSGWLCGRVLESMMQNARTHNTNTWTSQQTGVRGSEDKEEERADTYRS